MQTKRDYQHAVAVVRAVIHEWDPYKLLASGAPQGEFDSEIASVVSQIPRMQSSNDATHVVSRVFSSSFEPDRFRPKHFGEVGEKLYQALESHHLLK